MRRLIKGLNDLLPGRQLTNLRQRSLYAYLAFLDSLSSPVKFQHADMGEPG